MLIESVPPPARYDCELNSGLWSSLLAQTTAGLDAVGRVRASILADTAYASMLPPGEKRLVVQSYAENDLDANGLPTRYAKPLGSTQRSVGAEDLLSGVSVDIIHLGVSAGCDVTTFAWIEAGLPNLEYDGMRARPPESAFQAPVEFGPVGAVAHLMLRALAQVA